MRIAFDIVPEFQTDSKNYEVISDGASRIKDVPGFTCEIGLRRGGGSKLILDELVKFKPDPFEFRTHIAIDPYGDIVYHADDTQGNIRCDYTNDMRDDAQMNMYLYAKKLGINYLFFNMEDTEFFNRFKDGVPVYMKRKELVNQYAFVHFDGPHGIKEIIDEINFFNDRAPKGAVWVFDDVGLYDHGKIDEFAVGLGWKNHLMTERKWSYIKD